MSIFDLFRRKPKPEISEKKKAFINKSGAKERKEWLLIWLAVLYMIIVPFNFSDTVAEYFPNLDPYVVLVSVPIAVFVGVICYKWLVKRMKSVEHATQAADYLDKDSVDVPKRTDTFIVYKSYSNGRLDRTSYDPDEGYF